MKKLFILFLCLFIFSVQASSAQIREISVPTLPDVAMASYDQFGPVIYYNPIICNQVGPIISEFFRAHEYGHHELGHLQREYFEANSYNRAWIRQKYEKEADCYAAKNLSEKHIKTVINFFIRTQGPNRPDWYHPTGYERATVLRDCFEDYYYEDDEYESECTRCDGLGNKECRRCRGEGGRRCRSCNGNGQLYCVYGPCPGCNFSGILVCGNCRGGGVSQCDKCYGTGEIKCSSCRGTGLSSR